MWWLDPGKEVLNVLFNRVLAPYVENLDLNQVNYGIGQGQLTLRNLRLKKGALDKFRLPVDVLEGLVPPSYERSHRAHDLTLIQAISANSLSRSIG
jgi:hypothetical protein